MWRQRWYRNLLKNKFEPWFWRNKRECKRNAFLMIPRKNEKRKKEITQILKNITI